MLEIFELLFRCLGGCLVTCNPYSSSEEEKDESEGEVCHWCCSKPELTNYDKPFLKLYT